MYWFCKLMKKNVQLNHEIVAKQQEYMVQNEQVHVSIQRFHYKKSSKYFSTAVIESFSMIYWIRYKNLLYDSINQRTLIIKYSICKTCTEVALEKIKSSLNEKSNSLLYTSLLYSN